MEVIDYFWRWFVHWRSDKSESLASPNNNKSVCACSTALDNADMKKNVWSGHHNVCLRASSSKCGRHRGKLFVECVTAERVYCGRALQVWQRPKWTFPQQRHTEAEIQEGRRWSASSRIHLLVLLHTFRSTIFIVDKSPSKFCLIVVCFLFAQTHPIACTHA